MDFCHWYKCFYLVCPFKTTAWGSTASFLSDGNYGELLEKSGLSLFIPMSHPRMRSVRAEKQSRATNSLEREKKEAIAKQ